MMPTSNEKKSEPCHWLPCSIDYDGVAPVDVFFRPESIHLDNNDGDNHLKAKEENDEKVKLEERSETKRGRKRKTIDAASFRGRGLLAKQPIPLSEQNIVGSVLTLSSSSSTASKCNIEIGEQFSEVHEWEHEWDVNKVAKGGLYGGRCGRRGGIANSVEFLQVLRSVRSCSII